MKSLEYIYILFLAVLLHACSVANKIPAGSRIYKGATIKVEKSACVKDSKNSLRSTLQLAESPRKNKFLLGHPYKVWWWYVIGEPKKEKGLKNFLRKRLGEPPIFDSKLNVKATSENMASLMSNLGYFRSTVSGDTTHVNYFTKAQYAAQIEPQYTLGKVEWVDDTTELIKLIKENVAKKSFLKEGDPYTLSTFSAEFDRLDLYLKSKGYYYFNPDYLFAYVDSTVGDKKVNAIMNVKRSAPEMALHPYEINSITLYPNYSLDQKVLDTARASRTEYDGLLIQDTTKKFKNKIFKPIVTYRPGSTYSSIEQNTTLNRLINLGTFKFVKNRFEKTGDSGTHKLDVFYYLTPLPKKSLQAQIDGFTKENNYLGTQLSVNWKNRNAFRGAEQLGVKTYGGIEATSADSLRNSNIRVGTEVSLRVPRYVIPFFKINEHNFYPPSTTFLLGYELFRRNLLYSKNLFRFNYEFTWKTKVYNQFTLAPVSLSYLGVTGVTDAFKQQLAANPALQLNVYPEATLGSYFNYSYNSGVKSQVNKWYFAGGIDLSGNIYGALTGAKNFREKSILGVPFAQYAKLDLDLHYTRKLNKKNLEWANRILFGIGNPYNNSKILPYGKLYTIGGSNSVRGFRARTLGPGTHRPTAEDQRFFQIIGGDYKILGNSELRIPITQQLSTALFIDAGNIWTKDTILFGQEGQLTKDWFKEIAVSSGFGIRFDATILLIRADLGIPLRKPFLPDGQRWVLDKIDFGSKLWRRENLILNIAIGLPF